MDTSAIYIISLQHSDLNKRNIIMFLSCLINCCMLYANYLVYNFVIFNFLSFHVLILQLDVIVVCCWVFVF